MRSEKDSNFSTYFSVSSIQSENILKGERASDRKHCRFHAHTATRTHVNQSIVDMLPKRHLQCSLLITLLVTRMEADRELSKIAYLSLSFIRVNYCDPDLLLVFKVFKNSLFTAFLFLLSESSFLYKLKQNAEHELLFFLLLCEIEQKHFQLSICLRTRNLFFSSNLPSI